MPVDLSGAPLERQWRIYPERIYSGEERMERLVHLILIKLHTLY
jgi:hypothetical protein